MVACAISRIRLNGSGNDISAITLMVTAQYCISSGQRVCLNVSVYSQPFNAFCIHQFR